MGGSFSHTNYYDDMRFEYEIINLQVNVIFHYVRSHWIFDILRFLVDLCRSTLVLVDLLTQI